VRVDVLNKNGSVESILENPDQIILLDTNFLISPDRSNLGARVILFKHYCQIWLDPLFEMFPNLAVHESVYDELIDATMYAIFSINKKLAQYRAYLCKWKGI